MKLNNLPEWSYTESEWQKIVDKTVKIEDGDRMVYDIEQYKRDLKRSKMCGAGLIW